MISEDPYVTLRTIFVNDWEGNPKTYSKWKLAELIRPHRIDSGSTHAALMRAQSEGIIILQEADEWKFVEVLDPFLPHMSAEKYLRAFREKFLNEDRMFSKDALEKYLKPRWRSYPIDSEEIQQALKLMEKEGLIKFHGRDDLYIEFLDPTESKTRAINEKNNGLPELLEVIQVEKLPGYVRGESPAINYRDEVVWSPGGNNFALAYTIFETTMCNEVGHLAWGTKTKDQFLFQTDVNIRVACNFRPFCKWLSETCFILGVQLYLPKKKTSLTPIVAIDIYEGHHVFYKSNYRDNDSLNKISEVPQIFNKFENMSFENAILRFT